MDEAVDYIYRIMPVVRNYDWGRPAESSLVYRLFSQQGSMYPGLVPNDLKAKYYAELWIGDHDAAPCRVMSHRRQPLYEPDVFAASSDRCTGVRDSHTGSEDVGAVNNCTRSPQGLRLSSIYKLMGRRLLGYEIDGPSILLKVLSIAKPLSLQIHPDQECAARMYKEKYATIVDCQAKPEMCLALCDFRFMCGLRPLSDIVLYADRYPSFARLIGDSIVSEMRNGSSASDGSIYLRLCRRLLTEVGETPLIDELVSMVQSRDDHDLSEEVLLTLQAMHGSEICICFAFILNCVEMQAGESCFIPPNTLHSYISGNCVELMNNSDNVIRCGLTTKYKDTDTVIQLLEVELAKGNRFPQLIHTVRPEVVSPFVKKYQPIHPVCNFAIWSFVVPSRTQVSQSFNNGDQPFMCIVLETNAAVNMDVVSMLHRAKEGGDPGFTKEISFMLGDAFLMSPNTTLNVTNNGSTDFVMYFGSEV